jgi:hypothetical protein
VITVAAMTVAYDDTGLAGRRGVAPVKLCRAGWDRSGERVENCRYDDCCDNTEYE